MMRSRFAGFFWAGALVATLLIAACAGEPAGPQLGSLSATISGLPGGVPADVRVTGPDGFSRTLTATESLSELAPGTYAVAANSVPDGQHVYQPAQAAQSVTVEGGGAPATATVVYALGTGAVTVTIGGLPQGLTGSVTVSGPNFTQTTSVDTTFAGLAPGSYSVTPSDASDGTHTFAGSPQTVDVSASLTPAAAAVSYAQATGTIDLTVTGLPGGANALVSIDGPGGYSSAPTGTTTITNLWPGTYTVTAQSVADGGFGYLPAPTSQAVSVVAAISAPAAVDYVNVGPTTLNLTVADAYIVQVTQRSGPAGGDVPQMTGRDAVVRVFVQASEVNSSTPDVRVRFYDNGTLVDTQVIPAPGSAVPQSINESDIAASWNVAVPAALVQPGLSFLVDVDPTDAIGELDESDNEFPAGGSPQVVDVRTIPPMQVRLIPVHQSVNGRIGDVTAGNMANYTAQIEQVFPTAGIDADLGAQYTTSAPVLQADDGNGAWSQILGEIRTLRATDGSSRYYYGVVSPNYSSGIAGLGYVPGSPSSSSKASIGWDRGSSVGWVMAHEVGHNHGRPHSPGCGAGSPDGSYPYSGGSIGVHGLDVVSLAVKSPNTHFDFMAYCSTRWISDYVFEDLVQWRQTEAGGFQALQSRAAETQVLLVWGRITSRGMILEPSITLQGRPSLPDQAGPYRISADAADGTNLLALSFQGELVADLPGPPERHFAFLVPIGSRDLGRLDVMRLDGPGGSIERRGGRAASNGAALRASGVSATRTSGSTVRLDWDAVRHPLVVVRDLETHRIVAMVRGGRADVVTARNDVELLFSDGVRSVADTVRVR